MYESEMQIQSMYFPVDCIISIIHEDYEGKSAGLALIGKDGVVGSDICLKDNPSPFKAITIHSGMAYQLHRSCVLDGFNTLEMFRYKLLNYAFNLNNQIGFSEMCNKLHKVGQQYCKFILLCRDWIPGELSFTHETIGHILGVRRETISEISYKLGQAGIINYRRSKIHIVDHQALKARYVVERTFGSQARWFGAKVLRYRGKAKAHAWHILQAMAYNLKRLPRLYVNRQIPLQSQEKCAF